MLLYLNTKISNKLDADIIFISIINYIFSIAFLKFIEHKNGMIGFFNIYIILILLVDFGFTLYYYIKTFSINVSEINDDIINDKFDIKEFKKEMKQFKKQSKVKIIANKSETNTEIKEFNKDIISKQDVISNQDII